MTGTIKAWHFVGDTLRDGSPIPEDGVTLKYEGEVELCKSGYHGSERPIDGLRYAPGSTICRTEHGGQIMTSDDKLVSSERTILWRVDGEALLQDFARQCALDVIASWDAPDVVRQWLDTGDESLRRAALSAAWRAKDSAALSAAWRAAESAAERAARSAQNERLEAMVRAAR